MKAQEQITEQKTSKKAGWLKTVGVAIPTALAVAFGSGEAKAANPVATDGQNDFPELAMGMGADNFPDSLMAAPNDTLFNEAHIDTSGNYIVSLANLDYSADLDNGLMHTYLLIEDLEDIYNTAGNSVIVNYTYTEGLTNRPATAEILTGTFPVMELTSPTNSIIHYGLYPVGNAKAFTVAGKSNTRIKHNGNTLKAKEFLDIVISITENDTIELVTGFTPQWAGVTMTLENGQLMDNYWGFYKFCERDDVTQQWKVSISGQDILATGSDTVIFHMYTVDNTNGGSAIQGFPICIKVSPASTSDNTINQPQIAYSTENCTNGTVEVTLTFDEPAKPVNGNSDWVGVGTEYPSGFYYQWEKTHNQNATYQEVFQDTVPNQRAVEIQITNIDTQINPPAVNITPNNSQWSETKRITLTFGEAVTVGNGWIADPSDPAKKFYQEFASDTTVLVTGTDCAGNEWSNSFSLNHFDHEAPVIDGIASVAEADNTRVRITVTAHDEGIGQLQYSFNEGQSWQASNELVATANGRVKVWVKDGLNHINSTGEIDVTEITTGIEEVEKAELKLYPNPVHDKLIIENGGLKIKSVEIYDLTGKIILNSQLSTLNSIDVSGLASGVYVVRVVMGDGAVADRKVVKE